MALSELQLDLIGKYISNSLNSEEKKVFEENLDNEEFRNELLLQGRIVDALGEAQDLELRKHFKTYNSGVAKKRFLSEPLVKYAAIFLLLVVAVFAFKQITTSSIDSFSLIEKYNAIYPAEIMQRGGDAGLNVGYMNALSFYANQKYDEAYLSFSQLDEKSSNINLYMSNCLIQMKRYTEAINLLSEMDKEVKSSEVEQNKDWYLAMAYLGNQNLSKVRNTLNKIAQDKVHLFNAKAISLLEELH